MNIKVSPIEKYSTLSDFCNDLGISKQRLKKFIEKKELKRRLVDKQEISLPIDLVNHYIENPNYIGPRINILFEDDLFIVLDKPSKINCHSHLYSEKSSVICFLRKEQKLGDFIFENSYEKGLIHRIDFETSGVLVYCKKFKIWNILRENAHNLLKEYIAIVSGKISDKGVFEDNLSSSDIKGKKVKVSQEGLYSRLEYKLLKFNEKENLSLVHIKLKHGRRHQIRVQFSHRGHPLLGDELYSGPKASRLFLHSLRYSFNVDDKNYQFETEISESFRKFFSLNRCLDMFE
ncbi:MAG: RNA pseudouridine synthase [Halobacteriovoraceae bacterium]|nr:RNA pseudouridine synthase [Halobacteriovoraceae bacterium]